MRGGGGSSGHAMGYVACYFGSEAGDLFLVYHKLHKHVFSFCHPSRMGRFPATFQ